MNNLFPGSLNGKNDFVIFYISAGLKFFRYTKRELFDFGTCVVFFYAVIIIIENTVVIFCLIFGYSYFCLCIIIESPVPVHMVKRDIQKNRYMRSEFLYFFQLETAYLKDYRFSSG